MIKIIVETTDGKFIGESFDDKLKKFPDGSSFTPEKIQNLGNGLVSYSNSNYVVLTREAT